MRLRSLLFLCFAAAALVPLLLTVPLASRRLRDAFGAELSARADAAAALASAEVDRVRAEVTSAVEGAARDPALEELALRLADGPVPADALRPLAQGRPLTVLALRDARGVTRSSAFLPARVGDVEPGPSGVATGGAPVLVVTEVQRPEAVELRAALLAAREVDGAGGVVVVGGQVLDEAWLANLARLAGARVRLEGTDVEPLQAGTAAGRVVERTLPLGRATLRVSIGSAAFDETRHALVRALVAAAGLGLLAALGAGLLLARAIGRPVEALTAGARAVAAGDLGTRVPPGGRGEVRDLVDAFNRMTEDLGHARRALVAAERTAAWEGVARTLAHELRNPLTPLRMSLETLLAARAARDARFDALFAESAPAMLEELERLRRTIDAFARFARMPAAAREPLELTAWATQALALHQGDAGVSVRLLPGPRLPVRADRDQLAQLLHNLLKNAAEAMPGGGAVTVRTRADGASAVLEVEDTGPGIPEEARARVLEPGVSTKGGGSGLGLAVAARIAEGHGGRLEVDGAKGGGALLRLVLPLEAATAPEPAVSPGRASP